MHPTDTSLRDFAAACVKEFLSWSIKQTNKKVVYLLMIYAHVTTQSYKSKVVRPPKIVGIFLPVPWSSTCTTYVNFVCYLATREESDQHQVPAEEDLQFGWSPECL